MAVKNMAENEKVEKWAYQELNDLLIMAFMEIYKFDAI